MASIPVLLNRGGGGTIAADPAFPGKVAAALKAVGVDADIELIDGGDSR